MSITPVTVQRNESGFWSHPKLPAFDESTTIGFINQWLNNQGLSLEINYFERTASEELANKWFVDGLNNCTEWQPCADNKGAFLLSIHDTEDYGPIALFAYPK